MQNIIYNIINKLLMNEVEDELLSLIENKDKIIFDVGCHTGNFTKNMIKLEKKTTNSSKYYLFDPNPKMQNFLKKLLEKENVNYFPLALDNSNEIKKFTINRYFEASGSSLKSAHREDKMYNMSRKAFMKLFQPFSKVQDYEDINVQTQSLDNFCKFNNIDRIDLLKLDTDGTEYEILLGAENLLSNNKIGIIFTEISGFKKTFNNKVELIVNFLNKYNYRLEKVYKMNSVSWFSNLKATDNIFVKND